MLYHFGTMQSLLLIFKGFTFEAILVIWSLKSRHCSPDISLLAMLKIPCLRRRNIPFPSSPLRAMFKSFIYIYINLNLSFKWYDLAANPANSQMFFVSCCILLSRKTTLGQGMPVITHISFLHPKQSF